MGHDAPQGRQLLWEANPLRMASLRHESTGREDGVRGLKRWDFSVKFHCLHAH